ncbi:MAG: hypothetical protein K2P81_17500 [Bacteriovoracaceae bacterium]|nr:hypothetical protein [Bacteriovoracaceae bacterium]
MNTNSYHDLKNLLHRLELMAELLKNKDFKNFSKDEIKTDLELDLKKLKDLFAELSSDQ